MTVWAQQQNPAPPESKSGKSGQAQQAKDDEPVAITEKSTRAETPAPKTTSEDEFSNFRYPYINNKGDVAFVGLYSKPKSKRGFGQGVFIRTVDGKWKVISEDEKAVNAPEPIQGLGLSSFNDNGDITYLASHGSESDKPADPNDPAGHQILIKNQGLYLRTAAGVKRLLKLGDEVPNMPSVFSGVSNATTNTKGVTAFIGTYVDPDGRGLFMAEDGKLRLVVRSGQKLNASEEGTFSEHYYPSQINDRNEVTFLGRINDKSGVFIAGPGGIQPVAVTGRPSPIKGANYMGFANRTPTINNKGEVAFAAFFDGPEAGRGLFFKGAGEVKVVARSGENIAGTTFNFTDFSSPALNSRGDIAFLGKIGGLSRGIFIKTEKGIEAIALSGQKIPGGIKDEVFNNFIDPSINDRGEVAFYAQWKHPVTGAEVGIFVRDEKGVLKAVAKRGEKMPK